MDSADTGAIKARLFRAALSPERRGELELAAGAWFGEAGPADQDAWADFLDFFALEWVDADGLTLLERTFDPLPPAQLRWLLGVRTGLFVIDEWEEGIASARDTETDEEIAIVITEPLQRRSLYFGRLLPDEGGLYRPSGSPDLYDPVRVIARMDLARRWAADPRKQLIERMSGLRHAFLLQREQRAAFVAFFGSDAEIFPDGDSLQSGMNAFMRFLLAEFQPPSLGGLTWTQDYQRRTGDPGYQIQLELGDSLLDAGATGVIFDTREGIHFLPDYGAFLAHLQGRGQHPDVVRTYLEEPGIGALPFRRAGETRHLAALLEVEDAPLESLLAPYKPPQSRSAPSVLSGLEY